MEYKYCTTFGMHWVHSDYFGVNKTDSTTHINFNLDSELLSHHKDTSYVGCHDINLLLNRKVKREISLKHTTASV